MSTSPPDALRVMLLSDDDRSELRSTRPLITDHGLADLTEALFRQALDDHAPWVATTAPPCCNNPAASSTPWATWWTA